MPIYVVLNRISGKREGLLQAVDDLDAQYSVETRWPGTHILDIQDLPQSGYREVIIGQREMGTG